MLLKTQISRGVKRRNVSRPICKAGKTFSSFVEMLCFEILAKHATLLLASVFCSRRGPICVSFDDERRRKERYEFFEGEKETVTKKIRLINLDREIDWPFTLLSAELRLFLKRAKMNVQFLRACEMCCEMLFLFLLKCKSC